MEQILYCDVDSTYQRQKMKKQDETSYFLTFFFEKRASPSRKWKKHVKKLEILTTNFWTHMFRNLVEKTSSF